MKGKTMDNTRHEKKGSEQAPSRANVGFLPRLSETVHNSFFIDLVIRLSTTWGLTEICHSFRRDPVAGRMYVVIFRHMIWKTQSLID